MKKIVPILLVLLFVFNLKVKAQTGNMIVFYKKEFTKKTFVENKDNKPAFNKFKKIEEKIINLMRKIEYKLKIKEGSSNFKVINSLIFEENIYAKAAVIPEGTGQYYNTKNIRLSEFNIFGEDFLISNEQLNWELKNETKKIGNYLCYKAIAIEKKMYRGKMKEYPITAWYSPEINVSFGPVGISGLPGLILEVNKGKIRFTATKINLNTKEKIKIERPTKGKKVTEKEMNEMISEAMGNFKKNKGL
ncbi:GLPGLI family protein [Tenacibaculum finnmarkense]|uniref:GLPGLI family protein n=1 Tax=Tenacibaculum finnmarkense TaxID=2781243 RepID=UPI00187BB923|nr:GLPGLI family protein [Tenacibaculum finnmarkense]MBE7687237.1 GLPGLI family protein [Tenacibaculum finnmarkense genomovar ulcerans]MCG8754550.1 GLPGLI family protein [Tenacibaculum finnmarkense]MCG8761182.1 GLPGLI family protein [Tenacibaculum finnmarkense]MCG8783247.1 GLPGLI family protein [Tenacibaculum finnmarkense]MCG8786556.1 GLPGLI family protein [Tenacibaculum finnmarkense]